MKKYLILSIIIIASILAAQNLIINSDFILETKYNSNILNLSQNDLDRFDSGNEPTKFSIKTSDDLITSVKVGFSLKHRLLAGHTQINKIVINFNKYLQYSLKENNYLEFSLKQFLSKKLNFGIYYYYYPEIYVNRYDSVLDPENIFRDFTYNKIVYIGKVNYKLNSKFQFSYKFGFSQLFYNKYFTEYDANNFENKIGIKIIPVSWISINSYYTYKISDAKAGDTFSDPQQVTIIKDASYKADLFELSINFPRVISLFSKPVNFGLDAKYEHYYFQAENELDEYHYGREDKTVVLNSNAKYKISKEISLKYFYNLKIRKTNSPYTTVEVDKEYKTFETGISINLSL